MSDPRLGRRYADGLYSAAKKANLIDRIADELGLFGEALSTVPQLKRMWVGYDASPEQKKAVVSDAFAEAHDLVRNFLCFLVDKKRETLIHDVIPAFKERQDEEKGIIRARLATAIELNDAEADEFVSLLKEQFKGEINLTREVDESLIAGFRLRFGNRIIDASVERSINEIRRKVGA